MSLLEGRASNAPAAAVLVCIGVIARGLTLPEQLLCHHVGSPALGPSLLLAGNQAQHRCWAWPSNPK